jgi:hypothetical protein
LTLTAATLLALLTDYTASAAVPGFLLMSTTTAATAFAMGKAASASIRALAMANELLCAAVLGTMIKSAFAVVVVSLTIGGSAFLAAPAFVNARTERISSILAPSHRDQSTRTDVILRDRAVAFLVMADENIFYTAGLLGGGQYSLPEGKQLDVIQAIALVREYDVKLPSARGTLAGLVDDFLGLCIPDPSRATILRRTADGGVIRIQVDLDLALRDKNQRLVIHPGDTIVLQQPPTDLGAFYLSQILKIEMIIRALRALTTTCRITFAAS